MDRFLYCGMWARAAPGLSFLDWISPTIDGQRSMLHGKKPPKRSQLITRFKMQVNISLQLCLCMSQCDDPGRFGPHVALSVHQLDSKSALLPAVTATSPGTFQVLDIDENSFVHIGGLGAHTQVILGHIRYASV